MNLKCIGMDTVGTQRQALPQPPLPAASSPPSSWVEAAFATGTVQPHSCSSHCPARKDESFMSDSLCASCKYSILLPGKSSSSANPLLCPCASQALFLTEQEPHFQPQQQRQENPRSLLWLGNPVHLQQAGGTQVLTCTPYLGGITTMGCPRLGLHMRTWASLALGFTSAFGGMGSILLRIRGCSC